MANAYVDPSYRDTYYEGPIIRRDGSGFNNIQPIMLINDIDFNQNNPNSRKGDNCLLTCCKVDYTILSKSNASTVDAGFINLYIVQQSIASDTPPVLTKILQPVPLDAPTKVSPISQASIDGFTNLAVIYSNAFTVNPTTKAFINLNTIDLNLMKATYKNQSGSGDELKKPLTNSLYVFAVADNFSTVSGGSDADQPTLSLSVRLCYGS